MNLSKYVAYGTFVNDIQNKKNIQKIFFENPESNQETNKEGNTTLFIAHKLPADYYINQPTNSERSIIIDCFAWISSKLHKISESTIEHTWRKTYEAYDLGQMIELIWSQKKAIIRLYDKEYPEQLFEGHPTGKSWLIDMRPFSYSWNTTTVLGSAAYLPELTNAHFYIQQKKQEAFNLFAINRYDFAFTPDFFESCKTNNNVVLALDVLPTDPYLANLKEELQREGVKNKDIYVISPNYQNLSTIISDYMIEQTRFDSLHIAEEIIETQS